VEQRQPTAEGIVRSVLHMLGEHTISIRRGRCSLVAETHPVHTSMCPACPRAMIIASSVEAHGIRICLSKGLQKIRDCAVSYIPFVVVSLSRYRRRRPRRSLSRYRLRHHPDAADQHNIPPRGGYVGCGSVTSRWVRFLEGRLGCVCWRGKRWQQQEQRT
jgi:hypothetical protein